MVDLKRRRQFAELLRHFAAGIITNSQYEKVLHGGLFKRGLLPPCDHEDRSLWAIYDLTWFFYDDIWTHRLKGRHALPREVRRMFARWILFLYSDCEYKHPFVGTLSSILKRDRLTGAAFNDPIWPFACREEFESALKHPPLLLSRA